MAITILIGLFTVRIVLNALGISDYGLYNVVSGIVLMLSFVNNTLASTTQRFLSYDLGSTDKNNTNNIFGTSMVLYIILCIIIFILSETIGLWYVNARLVIPEGRLIATNWIYQFSIASFIFTVLSAPYNACIIAHEKMDIYAYISIVESILKLGLIYLLLIVRCDRLILYGFFMMLLPISEYFFYRVYCRKYFAESHYVLKADKSTIKEYSQFIGWNMGAAISNVFMGQGVNLLLNAFFSVVINAARGIAYQVDRAVNTLVQNFYTAIRPQVVKSFAAGDYSEMYKLVFNSTRLGYYLMLIITIFFIERMDAILSLWLGKYPPETILFADLVLISNLIIVISQPFSMVVIASGKIAKYQLITSIINISVLPLSWIIIKYIHNYNVPFYVIIVSSILVSAWTIYRTYWIEKFDIKSFAKICMKMVVVTSIISIVSALVNRLLTNGIYGIVLMFALIMVISIASIWCIDLSKTERSFVRNYIHAKLNKSDGRKM